jgi:hypothetical protein
MVTLLDVAVLFINDITDIKHGGVMAIERCVFVLRDLLRGKGTRRKFDLLHQDEIAQQ